VRTKDLEKMIKTEAFKIEIPDVSLSIKEKLENYKQTETILHPSTKNTYQLRFALKLGLSFVLIFFISIATVRMINTDPITDDTIVEAVALSTMTTSTIAIDALNVSYDNEEVILLAQGSNSPAQTETEAIETDVNHLSTYLGVIENLTSSANTFNVNKRRMNAISNKYQLTFSTSDLEDTSAQYALTYEKMSKNGNIYEISGSLTVDDESFQIEVSYDKSTKTTLTKMYQNENQYVEVTYGKNGNTFEYTIERYLDGALEESVEISYQQRQQITLSFVNSEASGTYNFSLETGLLGRKYLSIDYDVEGHTGIMNIAVSATNRNIYMIQITPTDGDTYTITKTRGRAN